MKYSYTIFIYNLKFSFTVLFLNSLALTIRINLNTELLHLTTLYKTDALLNSIYNEHKQAKTICDTQIVALETNICNEKQTFVDV